MKDTDSLEVQTEVLKAMAECLSLQLAGGLLTIIEIYDGEVQGGEALLTTESFAEARAFMLGYAKGLRK